LLLLLFVLWRFFSSALHPRKTKSMARSIVNKECGDAPFPFGSGDAGNPCGFPVALRKAIFFADTQYHE
jgi:hypothetical protein